MTDNGEVNVNKVVKVESLENLHSSNQAQSNKIQELNQEIVKFHDNSLLDVCKNNTRLDDLLETAVNQLKDQLCVQHYELTKLRGAIKSNNTGKCHLIKIILNL